MSKLTPRTFVVLGLGNFGASVASDLARFGNHVIGVDSDSAAVNRMADKLPQAVIADARDEDALKEIGVGDCDVAIIAMGEDMEASIVSAIAIRMVGVKEVWAKAVSKMHHRILSKVGVDRVIHPEDEMGRRVAQMLHNPLVRDYVSLGNGFHVVNIVVPERMAGKSVTELDLKSRFDLRCVGVMQASDYKGDDDHDCALEEGDLLILLGRRSDLRDFADTA